MRFIDLLLNKNNDKESLSSRILVGILKMLSTLSLIALTFGLALFGMAKNKVEQYTCNYLSTASELLSYQVGRELALNNEEVAETLVAQFSDNIKKVIPSKLELLYLERPPQTEQGISDWTCGLTFNKVLFQRPVVFGQEFLGFIRGQLQIFDQWLFILVGLGFLLLVSFLSYTLFKNLFALFDEQVIVPLKLIVTSNFETEPANLSVEMREIVKRIVDEHKLHLESERRLAALQSDIELSKLASQVAHDIRSPLAALTMISNSLSEISEPKRILVRNSINRINDIANSLLNRGKKEISSHQPVAEPTSADTIMISSLIEDVVSEKRIHYGNDIHIVLESNIQKAYGLFISGNSSELKRVLSNLINNSYEAIKSPNGRIAINVGSSENEVQIHIVDNGQGMPPQILSRLGEMGLSYGKEYTSSGSGLGIYHAKKTVEHFSGTFEVESGEGVGTHINLSFPKARTPDWFVSELKLVAGQTLVICDDDSSIHGLWTGRLHSLTVQGPLINDLHFSSEADILQWFSKSRPSNDTIIFLIDYEFLNSSKTGLDIIEELGIASQSILVTSRYEEGHIKERCNGLGVRLIPKGLAGLVPIVFQDQTMTNNITVIANELQTDGPNLISSTPSESASNRVKYDFCLIDDDSQLIHKIWGAMAKEKHLQIMMFTTPQEFRSVADKIDRLTPIYIDVSLGEGIRGTDFAYEVHKLGFVEINLATGYGQDSIDVPPFIRRVVGKDFPQLD